MKLAHTMIRVTDLDATLDFYLDFVGLKELKRKPIAAKYEAVRWIRYMGENSIVVYLAFFWFMTLTAYLLVGVFDFSDWIGTFGFLITAGGIVGSVGLFWLVRTNPLTAWLFERPRWLYIGQYEDKPAATPSKA